MARVNLLFDGNGFAFKAISVYEGIDGKKLFNMDTEKISFLKLLTTNFIAEVYRFKQILGKVVVVADSRSWRYDYYSDYKSNRTKKEDIQWENYALLVNKFYSIIAKFGIIISKSNGAEGDDMIFGWVEHFKSLKDSTIILSSDRDMLQLLQHNDNHFTIMFDSRFNMLFMTKDTESKLPKTLTQNQNEIVDIFSLYDDVVTQDLDDEIKNLLNSMIKRGTTNNIVNVKNFLFNKILTGDSGDGVDSAYNIVKKDKNGNDKKYGIGDKTAETICTQLMTYNFKLNDLYDEAKLNVISEIVYDKLTSKNTKMEVVKSCSKDDVKTNLNRNVKVLLLNENSIPVEILNGINENISKHNLNELSFKDFVKVNEIFEKVKQPNLSKLF